MQPISQEMLTLILPAVESAVSSAISSAIFSAISNEVNSAVTDIFRSMNEWGNNTELSQNNPVLCVQDQPTKKSRGRPCKEPKDSNDLKRKLKKKAYMDKYHKARKQREVENIQAAKKREMQCLYQAKYRSKKKLEKQEAKRKVDDFFDDTFIK